MVNQPFPFTNIEGEVKEHPSRVGNVSC